MHGTRRTIVTVAASFAVVLGVGGVAAATSGNDSHAASPTSPAVAAIHVARTKAAVRVALDETSTTVDPATSTTVADETTTTLEDTTTTMVAPETTTTLPTTSTTVDHDKDGDHKLCDDHGKDGDHHDKGRHVGRNTDHDGARRVGPPAGAQTTRSEDNSGSGSHKSGDSGSHRSRG